MKVFFRALWVVCLWASVAAAQSSFYEGKTVRIVVGFSPGGTYDLWARLVAHHLSKHVPGNPSFTVQNMAGGGSMIAANHVYHVAKPDGLTLGLVTPALYIEQLMGRKEVQHDWFRLSYVGSPERTARIFYIRADTGYKAIEELRKAAEPPKCGATGAGTASYYWPKLLADALGFKLNIVPGYPGAADVNLAIEKGEMHCWGGTVQAFFGSEPGRTWAKTGFVRVLAQGGHRRDPRLPDVPTVFELMAKHNASETTRSLTKALLAPDDLGRPLFGPPGIPADRVKLLRDPFAKVMSDPDVLSEARKKGMEPNPIGGEELENMVKELAVSPEIVQRMKTYLQN
ncbi:MAG TPA: tripartite tricarboxylate transporter substrate binding protein [Candidatus Binatia bacterium]|nr:tripartite tricarboxylate transporter substrate binding protein [Candidatus Binatia bacterium]